MSDPPEHEERRDTLESGSDPQPRSQLDGVLQRVLAEARALTGARYAAVGVLDEERLELRRFITAGIDEATRQQIGHWPRGRGVLGLLITAPRPLRLADVAEHPESYGFPPGHPVMRRFLGTPILIESKACGNLYVGDKEGGGEFTQADEATLVELSRWAGRAIAALGE